MALRSILDIDVDTSAIDRLQAKVDKFQNTAKNLPSVGGFGAAAGTGARGAVVSAEEKAVPYAEKLTRQWSLMRDHTKEVVRNVREMAQRLLSISGIMAGISSLATLGGAFGFDKLAKDASNLRNQAFGAGTTPGGLRGANIALGRFGDMTQLMSSLKTGAQTIGSPAFNAMRALGMNPQAGDDSFKLLQEFLPKVRERFLQQEHRQPGTGMRFLSAIGADQLVPPEMLRQLTGRSGQELTQQIGEARQTQERLDIPDSTLRTFQDFIQKLQTAGATIEKTFIVDLAAVAKPLGDLSEAITKVLVSLINSALKPENVKAVSDGLERFAKYLDTQFLSDFDKFTTQLGEAVTALEGFVSFLKNFFSGAKNDKPATLEEQPGTKPAVSGWGYDKDGRWRWFKGTDGAVPPAASGTTPPAASSDTPPATGQTPPAFEGWHFGPGGLQRGGAPGTDDAKPSPWDDPIFKRETPHSLLHRSAFQTGTGGSGGGIPVYASRPLPVEIVGFRMANQGREQAPPPEAPPYQSMVREAAYRTPGSPGAVNDNLGSSFLDRIERVESGGNPMARSTAGALGPMQFMPGTWERFAKPGESIWNERDARTVASRYLGYMAEIPEIGLDEDKLAAGYNAGERRVVDAVRKFGADWKAHLPDETQRYIPMVRGAGQDKPDFHPKPNRDQMAVVIQNQAGGDFVVQSRKIAT